MATLSGNGVCFVYPPVLDIGIFLSLTVDIGLLALAFIPGALSLYPLAIMSALTLAPCIYLHEFLQSRQPQWQQCSSPERLRYYSRYASSLLACILVLAAVITSGFKDQKA